MHSHFGCYRIRGPGEHKGSKIKRIFLCINMLPEPVPSGLLVINHRILKLSHCKRKTFLCTLNWDRLCTRGYPTFMHTACFMCSRGWMEAHITSQVTGWGLNVQLAKISRYKASFIPFLLPMEKRLFQIWKKTKTG